MYSLTVVESIPHACRSSRVAYESKHRITEDATDTRVNILKPTASFCLQPQAAASWRALFQIYVKPEVTTEGGQPLHDLVSAFPI